MTLQDRPILAYEPRPQRPPVVSVRTSRLLVRTHYALAAILAAAVVLFSACAEPTGVFFTSVLGGVMFVMSCAIVALVVAESERPHRWRNFIAANLACAAIVISVARFEWPMRLTFAASRAALERLADQIHAGLAPPLPARAGLFTVRATELRSGAACLWTDPNSAGPSGFVRCPSASQPPPVNIWMHSPLGGAWHYVEED